MLTILTSKSNTTLKRRDYSIHLNNVSNNNCIRRGITHLIKFDTSITRLEDYTKVMGSLLNLIFNIGPRIKKMWIYKGGEGTKERVYRHVCVGPHIFADFLCLCFLYRCLTKLLLMNYEDIHIALGIIVSNVLFLYI